MMPGPGVPDGFGPRRDERFMLGEIRGAGDVEDGQRAEGRWRVEPDVAVFLGDGPANRLGGLAGFHAAFQNQVQHRAINRPAPRRRIHIGMRRAVRLRIGK
jgi:hypothetical protein